MEEYIVNGITYSKNELEQFAVSKDTTLTNLLEKNPSIQVKTSPISQDALVGTGTASGTVYKSGNIFLDSQEDEEPGLLTSLAARTARGFVSAAKGISSLVDGIKFGIYNIYNPDLTANQKIAIKADIERGFTDDLENAEEWLSQFTKRTESDSVLDAIKQGNFGDAAELIVGGALESLPSIAAAMTGYGGIALFGASVAGNKFDEEFDRNPDEALGRLAFNSIGSGAIEAGFEIATRGLLKQAGFIGAKNGVDAAKDFLKQGAASMVKKVGYGYSSEAISEASTEVSQILFDALPRDLGGLGRNTEIGEAITRVFDAGAIGGFVGGTISTAGSIQTNAAKERAELALMDPRLGGNLQENVTKINQLVKKRGEETDEGVLKIIDKKINELEGNITRIKRLNSNMLAGMTKEELEVYSENYKGMIEQNKISNKEGQDKQIVELADEEYDKFWGRAKDVIDRSEERRRNENIEKAKKEAEKLKEAGVDIEFEVFENAEERSKKAEELKKDDGFFEKRSTAEGVILQNTETGKQVVFVDREMMREKRNITAANHEIFHAVMFKTLLDNPGSAQELGAALKLELEKLDLEGASNQVELSDFNKRLKLYEARLKSEKGGEEILGEEAMALFSDAITTGDIKYNENIFTKIGDVIRRILQNVGLQEVTFDSGRDVYNFIKDYNKSGVRGSVLKGAVSGFAGRILKPKGDTAKGDIQKFSVSETGKRLSEEVQQIYEQKGEAGAAEIISRFGPIVNKLVLSRTGAPGFDYELLKTELEYGLGKVNKKGETKLRSMLGLIRDYDPSKGVPLAAYINTRLYQRLIEASRAVLKEKFDIDTSEVQIQDLESALENNTTLDTADISQEDVDDLIKPLEELVENEEAINEIKNAILSKFNIEEYPNLNYATLPDLAPEITKTIFGELTQEEKQGLTKNEQATALRNKRLKFIRDNAEVLHALLPLGAMMQAGGESGLKTSTKIQSSVLKNLYEKGERPSIQEGGTEAGLPTQTKLPFDQEMYDDLFGPNPSIGLRNQKETLFPKFMVEIGRAITNSVVRNDLLEQGIEGAIVLGLADGKSRELYSESIKDDRDVLKPATGSDKTLIQLTLDSKIQGLTRNTLKGFVDEKAKTLTDERVKDLLKYLQRSFAERGGWRAYAEKVPNVFGGASKPFYEFMQRESKRSAIVANFDDAVIQKMYNPQTKTMDLNRIEKQNNLEDRGFLFDMTVDLVQYAVDKKLSPDELYLLFTGLNNAKNSMWKMAAPITISTNLKGESAKDFTGDHLYAGSRALAEVYRIVKKHGSKSAKGKKLIQLIKDNYHVGVIPKDIGKKINEESKTSGSYNVEEQSLLNRIYKYAPEGTEITDNRPVKTGTVEKFSLSNRMNEILEETKGVAKQKIVGETEADILGRRADKMKFLVPYSAEDLEGLIYYFAGKGKQGDKHLKFFKENIFDPLSQGLLEFDAAKQLSNNKLIEVKKALKKSGIDLGAAVKSEKEPNLSKYTNEQVIRLFMWLRSGYDIPGDIPLEDKASIMRYVRQELDFMQFTEDLNNAFPDNAYPEPSEQWLDGTLVTDMQDTLNVKTRAEYLQPFFNNISEVFGDLVGNKLQGDNINKIKSIYGTNFVASLENILYRIKTGRNRPFGSDRVTNAFMNWTNDAVGTIMFFNTRSALLQMISFANYINWSDNNFAAATARFLDQPQFWKDFAFIFNSDYLKQRRSGLRIDVNADELTSAAKNSKNKFRAAISAILKKGFLPTQIADSLAISIGGASFYRNRINKYLKEGLTQEEAETKAFSDFSELTQASQQSSRPDRISMQQAGPLGRVILAFQNTPMQYTRLIKKAVLDLKNGRGDWKENVSKIAYYAAIQNIIFHSLQSAMFAMLFADDEEEKDKEKYFNLGNRVADSLLIGTGVYGAIAATTKNVILEVIDQEKSGRRDFEKAAIKSTALSPPINSKLQKLLRASRRFQYKQEREKIREMGISTQNPAVISAGEVLSAVFNLPADRAIRKWNNLVLAADSETELWQSIALALGYSEWDVKLAPSQQEPAINVRTPIQRQKIKREEIKREQIKRD